jgi:hypothetical protein
LSITKCFYTPTIFGNFVFKPPALKNFILFCASRRNRILLGGKLIMNFQKQYELLSNLPPQARAIGSSEAEQKAINEKWWT